jgi:hypothetical protein
VNRRFIEAHPGVLCLNRGSGGYRLAFYYGVFWARKHPYHDDKLIYAVDNDGNLGSVYELHSSMVAENDHDPSC